MASQLTGRERRKLRIRTKISGIAERPRLADHTEKMQRAIADALGVSADCVNVKVTSTDGLGAIGRGEGIAALAVALLERRRDG